MCMACDQVRAILQECANRQGHNKCWWNPEVLTALMTVYGIKPTVPPNLPTRREFGMGCEAYADELFGKRKDKEQFLIHSENYNEFTERIDSALEDGWTLQPCSIQIVPYSNPGSMVTYMRFFAVMEKDNGEGRTNDNERQGDGSPCQHSISH